jgi:hypothetical protein
MEDVKDYSLWGGGEEKMHDFDRRFPGFAR